MRTSATFRGDFWLTNLFSITALVTARSHYTIFITPEERKPNNQQRMPAHSTLLSCEFREWNTRWVTTSGSDSLTSPRSFLHRMIFRHANRTKRNNLRSNVAIYSIYFYLSDRIITFLSYRKIITDISDWNNFPWFVKKGWSLNYIVLRSKILQN